MFPPLFYLVFSHILKLCYINPLGIFVVRVFDVIKVLRSPKYFIIVFEEANLRVRVVSSSSGNSL